MALSVFSGVHGVAFVLSGFVLLEVAFAILILGVVGSLGLTGYRTICEHRAYSTTEQRIERVFMALAQYAKRHGSIPCPATPESHGVGANQGMMSCPQFVGLVPYATLQISNREASDGWQRPIVYAMDAVLHPSKGDIKTYDSVLGAFCEAQVVNLSITHDIGQSAALHPAVVLLSHGPKGYSDRDASKAYNAAPDNNFVDQSVDSSFDDIVRFVTRDHLLAFYGQSGCPTQVNE